MKTKQEDILQVMKDVLSNYDFKIKSMEDEGWEYLKKKDGYAISVIELNNKITHFTELDLGTYENVNLLRLGMNGKSYYYMSTKVESIPKCFTIGISIGTMF